MFGCDLCLGMLMTAIAGIGCKLAGVTGLATAIAISVIDREGMVAIERGRQPCRSGMTCNAVRAKLTGVFLRIGMTGNTFLGRAFENIVRMTRLTGRIDMRPAKLEA